LSLSVSYGQNSSKSKVTNLDLEMEQNIAHVNCLSHHVTSLHSVIDYMINIPSVLNILGQSDNKYLLPYLTIIKYRRQAQIKLFCLEELGCDELLLLLLFLFPYT
jgi:hypothetical protein